MATVILDTGVLDTNLNVGQAEGTRTQMPLEAQVFPSLSNEEALVSVQAGTMMVVTAYGSIFSSDDEPIAHVYKVLLAEPVATRTVSACSIEAQRSEVSMIAEAKICSMTLTGCSPIIVIDIPGVYRIAPLDSDLTITAMAHPLRYKV